MKRAERTLLLWAGWAGLVLWLAMATGCYPLRDSPYSNRIFSDERNLNMIAQAKLEGVDVEDDGIVKIFIFGDSHQNYKDLAKVVGQINASGPADFIVNMGDFTNSSYNYEYDQFLRFWSDLKLPAFIVPGNHDLLGAGPSLFEKIFGAMNYIFESKSYRFVFFNGNNLESPKLFDPNWLLNAVNESTKKVVIFSHVPLDDRERFHGGVRDIFSSVLDSPKVHAAINGHNHVFKVHSRNGTKMIQSPRVEGGQWITVEFLPTGVLVTNMKDGKKWQEPSKPSLL